MALDKSEGCTEEDDKRESGLIQSVFQRFALLYYYSYYLTETIDQLKEIHTQWL